jgi:hypothetical protein
MFHSRVSNGLDSGAGSLRQALISAADGSRLIFNEGLTVTLLSPLDGIAKNLVIEGNGATLTQSGFTPSAITQLLRITGGQVRISRLHFKGGRTTTYGGAVYTAASGDLTLESCIFSDNRATGSTSTAQGGAVYAAGNLTVLGCTFYGNSAGTQGGAISRGGTSFLTLTGNVFWGNTAPTYPVLYTSSATGFTSGGFNVSDKAGGTETSASGWAFTNGDKPAAVQILSSVSFRPIGGGEALGVITEKPADYPALDFHGELIPETSAAAGAVQTPTGSGGYILDYAAQGPGQILVSGGTPDADGLLSGSVTLTASAGEFAYWTVDGAKQPDQSPPEELALTMDAHKIVRAVFYNIKVANTNDSGPGTLRQALADAADGDRIGLSAGQTIALTSARLEANKNLIIEGNGATLTQDGFTASSTSQLLYIASGKEVRISRLHFKGGRATESAGAIYNNGGKLTLESCIFSDNQASDFLAGGAINTSGASATLTVLGCTFYANKATATSSSTAAGAIRKLTGTATLTGNVFFGNTAPSRPVVYASSGLTSGGYNVSDKAGGTGTSASGWNFTNGDVNPADLSVDSDAFQPSSASLPVIASPPAGFPTVYFDGTVRKTSGAASAPGAMPAALAAE